MSNFDEAIEIVLRHEGGYVNDPHDAGGETKYGISKRSYPQLDIASLTIEEAKNIYRKDYWDAIFGDKIKEQYVANKALDLAVNMGCKNAIKCLQRAYRASSDSYLQEDGVMGSNTLAAINSCNSVVLLAAIKSEAAGYYRALGTPRFINGWLERAYS